MTTLATPAPPVPLRIVAFAGSEFDAWLRHRQECGGDRRDEVWDGVYVVMPLANNDHQRLVGKLTSALANVPGVTVYPGCNVSDSRDDWMSNFRCPDVAVFLPGNPAEDRKTHFLGGPDFAVEIVSKYDRSREKFEFYRRVGVRELLFIDRHPEWSLELYRCQEDQWILVGKNLPGSAEPLISNVLPVSFRLHEDSPRPRIEITRLGTDENDFA